MVDLASGIVHDLFASERARMLWGAFFMLMGVGWVFDNYTGYRLNVGSLWPVALVVLGALVFLSSERLERRHARGDDAQATPAQR